VLNFGLGEVEIAGSVCVFCAVAAVAFAWGAFMLDSSKVGRIGFAIGIFLGFCANPILAHAQSELGKMVLLDEPNACWAAETAGRIEKGEPIFTGEALAGFGHETKGTSYDASGRVKVGKVWYRKIPCPPPPAGGWPGGYPTYGRLEISGSVGTSTASTNGTFGPLYSITQDAGSGNNTAKPSGTGFTGVLGASAALGELANPFSGGTGGTNPITRYAPEAEKAYAASFPIKAPPQPRAPGITWGVDGNVYFFAGGDQNITGIPGGPFGTATGTDSFKISNNYMFTAGGWITAPITPAWSVSLTGGFAELNQTVKYNCSSFCAVAPATGAFTASQDKWVPGGYVGGRVTMPIAIPALPVGTNIGIDYKHVFFESYNVSLGTIPTRQVNARLSPDMDLVTVRLGIPIQ
jgi:hypothetical protein